MKIEIVDQVKELVWALKNPDMSHAKGVEIVMMLVRNVVEDARGSAPAALLSALPNGGTDSGSPVEGVLAERVPSIAGARALLARQGIAEEEERLCRGCNGEGIVLDNVTVCEEFRECPACKGTGKRPDETATGERGEVLSGEAQMLRDWMTVWANIGHGIDEFTSGDISMTEMDSFIINRLLRSGFLVSRISGDGTSERRADNAKADGMLAENGDQKL